MNMDDEYAKYEEDCGRIRQENAELIDEFADWLTAKGLADKTVGKHCGNIDFYLNHYMLYYDARDAASGVSSVGMFLGEWFVRKAMWSSETSIRANAASLKKFYTFMLEKGKISKFDLDELKDEIKECMPEWLETMAKYEDLDVDIEDIWGF